MSDSIVICADYNSVHYNERDNKLFVTTVWDTLSDNQQTEILYVVEHFIKTKTMIGKKLGGGASRIGYRISNSLVCKRTRVDDYNWGGHGGQTRSEFELWLTVESDYEASDAMDVLSPTIAMFGNGELIFQFFCSMPDVDIYDAISEFEREVEGIVDNLYDTSSKNKDVISSALHADNHRGNIRTLGNKYVKIDYGI